MCCVVRILLKYGGSLFVMCRMYGMECIGIGVGIVIGIGSGSGISLM